MIVCKHNFVSIATDQETQTKKTKKKKNKKDKKKKKKKDRKKNKNDREKDPKNDRNEYPVSTDDPGFEEEDYPDGNKKLFDFSLFVFSDNK